MYELEVVYLRNPQDCYQMNGLLVVYAYRVKVRLKKGTDLLHTLLQFPRSQNSCTMIVFSGKFRNSLSSCFLFFPFPETRRPEQSVLKLFCVRFKSAVAKGFLLEPLLSAARTATSHRFLDVTSATHRGFLRVICCLIV